MKKYIIYALIYLLGCVCSYNKGKAKYVENQKVWTNSDRNFTIFFKQFIMVYVRFNLYYKCN